MKQLLRTYIRPYKYTWIALLAATALYVLQAFMERNARVANHPWTELFHFIAIGVFLYLPTYHLIRRKKVILGNIAVLVLLLWVLEFTCFLLMGAPPRPYKVFKKDPKKRSLRHDLGMLPKKNKPMDRHKVVRGDTVFKVRYNIDKHSRRVVPGYDSTRSKYALFFGCSVGFGFGLEDHQNLPAWYQKLSRSYNCYNYSFIGWGTQHMLARMEWEDLSKQVREKDGVAYYVFIAPHVRRAIGDMNIYNRWGYVMPHYTYKDGELVRDGNFHSGRPLRNWFYRKLYRSYIVRYFDIRYPLAIAESHLRLTADIIAKSAKTYRQQFGNDNFYVLLHPTTFSELTIPNKDRLVELLRERGIKCLDYSETIKLDKAHRLVGDPHPNERTYREVAELLVRDMPE